MKRLFSGRNLCALFRTITPADLHYERHHEGVPTINPENYELYIYELVE